VGPGCDPQTLNSDLALVLMRDLKGRSDGECDLHEDLSAPRIRKIPSLRVILACLR
jgi:hypothetical protein